MIYKYNGLKKQIKIIKDIWIQNNLQNGMKKSLIE